MVTMRIDLKDKSLQERFIKRSGEVGPKLLHFVNSMLHLIRNDVIQVSPHGRTGRFKRSIQSVMAGYGGKVYGSRAIAPHFDWVVDGRGPVYPVRRKALRWVMYGKEIFARRAGSAKGNPVFDKAYPQAVADVEREMTKFANWVENL